MTEFLKKLTKKRVDKIVKGLASNGNTSSDDSEGGDN